jgi:hypothetical protein
MITFMLSNNLHCIDNICKAIHGPYRNELLLKKARGSNDLAKLVVVMANYTFRSSFTNRLPHLEGEKVYESTKRPIDYPLVQIMIPIVLTM